MKNYYASFLIILLFIGMAIPAHSQKDKKTVQQPELAKEIRAMRDKEQKMRIKWSGMVRKGKTETDKFKELTQRSIAEDRANTARMREIVAEYGWPTYDLVGQGPSNNAWLIVQHADRNPLFQKKCLPLLKAAVDNNQANPSNYAYLYDRVQVAMGEKQLYATQSTTNNGLVEGSFQAIDDESNVQNRREQMGIDRSVVEYAESNGFSYELPTKEEAEQRAQRLASDYQINLKLAKEAIEEENYSKAADFYLLVTNANGSVTTEDFLEAARVLSLSEHEKANTGSVFLRRCVARGWDGFDQVNASEEYAYLRTKFPANWADLGLTAKEAKLDK